ncbi:hypothetical protein [Paraburkholderia caribensis]|uniref:hypothetical protein n=1 Tax=Paraburkholderia caribensis TaxID=75105 RepID=UPI002858B2BF|nr:hypothetical protein [Paraburkholderia caribensis]MDR6384720.1 hypothetical protein [Paraburkholderia caribensis]
MKVLYLAAPFYGDSPFSSGTLKNRIEIFKRAIAVREIVKYSQLEANQNWKNILIEAC